MSRLRQLGAFVRRDLLTEASYRANFFFGLAGGAFSLLLFFFLAQVVDGAAPGLARYRGGYFPFVLVGLAFTALLDEALTGFSRRVRQAQVLGTLEAVLATPVPPGLALLGEAAAPLGAAALRGAALLALGALLFGADLSAGGLPAAVLAGLLGGAALAALGLISAAATVVLKRGDPVAWALGGLSTLLSGVYFPVEILPAPLQRLALLLPLTHVLRAVREALLGGGGPGLSRALLVLAAFVAVLAPLAAATLAWALRRARRDGSLTHF